jgi:dipeptidyl aminopeptidase/acylaminoacyl peptidase
MFADFDINTKSNTLAVLEYLSDGSKKITVTDIETKKTISEVGNSYISQGPRISPSGEELAFFGNGKMFVQTLKNQSIRLLSNEPNVHTNFCEWSNDSSSLCFGSFNKSDKTPPTIYYMDTKGQKMVQLTDSKGVDRFPQWSPSSKYIAFHRQYLHERNQPKSINIIDVDTEESFQIPRKVDTTHEIGRFCWSKDSGRILVKEISDSSPILKVFDLKNKSFVCKIDFPNLVGGIFFPQEDKILVICKNELFITSFPDGKILKKLSLPQHCSIQNTLRGPAAAISHDSEFINFLTSNSCIYRLDLEGQYDLLLQASEEVLPAFEKAEYEVSSRDGRKIPVHHFIPENPKPMGIVFVIGGPGGSVDSKDSVLLRILKEGYEVVAPVYRGCSGYGKEHQKANNGEYGRADVSDVIACSVDWKNKTNQERPLAVIGYSYGGFLTFLSLSNHEAPFDCGITLWGVTRIENLPMHLPKAFPNSSKEKAIAKVERNPLDQAHKISAPLLILHGGQDTTSTNEEIQIIEKQINSHGGICELVIFEDDTHGLAKNRKEMFNHIFTFLSENHNN